MTILLKLNQNLTYILLKLVDFNELNWNEQIWKYSRVQKSESTSQNDNHKLLDQLEV